MGTKLTQLALVLVFGLIVIFLTLIVFQAWYNNTAPTQAEVQTLVNQATKIDVGTQLVEFNGRYNTANSIDAAGRIIAIVEGIVLALMIVYGLARMIPEPQAEDESTLRRAYES
jgi:hypothetical protein